MHPLVLVVCDGTDTTPENVIAKIRDRPETEDVEQLGDSLVGYRYEITNKYYTVPVVLCPIKGEGSLKNYPLLSKVEGILLHFDPADKTFLSTRLSNYLALEDDCNLECKILLCDKLFDDESDGITYAPLKSQSQFWDVIELSRETTEDEADAVLNPVGYDELRDALQNIIWSNVEYSGSGMNDLIAQLTGTNFAEAAGNNPDQPQELNEELVEEELDVFEKLLTQLLTVQSNTGSWSRNERLAYIHDMATALDNIIEKED